MYKQTKLFKKYNYPSWGIDRNINTPGERVFIKKDTPATNWIKYLKHCQTAGAYGTGYIVNRYKRNYGIKGATVFKPKKPTAVNTFAQGFIKFGIEQGYIK
tara:strand:- start:155 stop:457 length:303 start_codon:yes stop_codon:yes gene_type:complete